MGEHEAERELTPSDAGDSEGATGHLDTVDTSLPTLDYWLKQLLTDDELEDWIWLVQPKRPPRHGHPPLPKSS
jgi:hypothetical protein